MTIEFADDFQSARRRLARRQSPIFDLRINGLRDANRRLAKRQAAACAAPAASRRIARQR